MAESRIEDAYPLTGLQALLLADAQMRKDLGTETVAFRLCGPVTLELIERAWSVVHDRHPGLRASLVWRNVPEPVQVVRRDARPHVRFAALQGTDESALDDAPWPLNAAPQIRLTVAREGPAVHRLSVAYRASLFDGWSIAVILREFLTGLDQLVAGEAVELPLARPFREYIDWLDRQDRAASAAFWRERLAGFPAPTPLRLSRPLDDRRQDNAQTVVKPSDEDREALRFMTRQLGLTANSIVQTLWGLLLARYSGTTDILFGTAVSGRPQDLEGADTMVGVFFNNVPLRMSVCQGTSFAELARNLQRMLTDSARHAHLSADEIRECWGVSANVPLFQSIVLFHNFPLKGTFWESGRAFTIEEIEKPIATALPLALVCVPELGYELRLIADGEVADAALRETYLGDLMALLRRAAESLEDPVTDIMATVTPPDARLEAPVADEPRDLADEPGNVPPAGEIEQKMAAIFEKLLNVRHIGVNDNFFDLGARSIQLARASVLFRQAGLGGFAAVDFLEHPTIRLLAQRLSPDGRGPEDDAAASKARAADARAGRRRRAERRGSR